MERKYENAEQTLNVAKEVIYLAWQACGGPMGMGILQDRGPKQDRESVWSHAYNQSDYAIRHGLPEDVRADYVMGRMMKLYFKFKGDTITHRDETPRRDYQAWCGKYPTYAALFDAAEGRMNEQTPHWTNPKWGYVNASETNKPNYLLDRFKSMGWTPPSEQPKKEPIKEAA